MKRNYDDMLYLKRPHSPHKKMSQIDRAAQFAPFAALTGHHEAILETERRTDEKIILSEEAIATLNEKIQMLKNLSDENPYIVIYYFLKDKKKKGGHYLKKEGIFKQVDEINKRIFFTNRDFILLEDILSIECNLFPQW